MIAMPTAIITIDHTGYRSHAKLQITLMTARITPMVRAHTAPLNSANPARATTMPMIRWIHPVVASNCR
jgi:hypothetical protein